MRYFITNFCGNLELTFVALHRVLKNKCDLFFVFLSVCTTLAAVECHSRTREACSAHRISLPYHRSPFLAPSAPENASRTTGACFLHRAHIPYHRRPSPVPNEPNATNGRGKKPLPQTEPSANSSQMPGKRPLPQTALLEIQQTPEKRGLFPRQHHRQIPHNRNPVAAGKYLFRRRCSHAWI